jgi:hypothetical protein
MRAADVVNQEKGSPCRWAQMAVQVRVFMCLGGHKGADIGVLCDRISNF